LKAAGQERTRVQVGIHSHLQEALRRSQQEHQESFQQMQQDLGSFVARWLEAFLNVRRVTHITLKQVLEDF